MPLATIIESSNTVLYVHGGVNIGVPHHLLLSRYRRTHQISPCAMSVRERVPTQMAALGRKLESELPAEVAEAASV